jgi:fructose-1-phosphate kinase PfkB-like protein
MKKLLIGLLTLGSLSSFKQSLRNLVSTDRLNVLKPLTPEEVEAYSKDGPNSDQIEAMVIELEKINNFIAVYGAENANLVRKEELLKALRSQETLVSAIKKINAEI